MPVSLEATRGGGPGSTWSLGEPVIASCRMMRTAEPSRVPQFRTRVAAVKGSGSARSLFGAFRRASRLSRSRLHQSWRNPTIAYLAMSSRFIDERDRPIGLYRMG